MSHLQSSPATSCLVACDAVPPARDTQERWAPSSLLGRLLQVCLQWRNRNRLRNTAEGLDEHILKDMGAPDWLVSEASVSREFKRLRNIDYFRW
ncbi:hypothetical protein [Achromobacter sp. 413638]|uniref:hypothetical protein n=1 Tax=Achromobacter sp. 413638 TaxID=3342385 RepID=UPI0032460228